MRNAISYTIGFIGFFMITGSAGDCDGACMDQANTMGEMLLLILGGFSLIGLAAVIFDPNKLRF
jgi:hypothetical protein